IKLPIIRTTIIFFILMFVTEKDDNLILLPSEIWTDVFQHISFQDLQLASLACRYFRLIASPQLFKEFRVQLYVQAASASMQHHTILDVEAVRELQKLHFFTSTSVAPFVRKCTVSAQLLHSQRPSLEYEGRPDRPSFDHVIDSIFQLLPRLFNIQKLKFARILFTPIAISQLSLLPNIPSLIIDTCHPVEMHPPFPVLHIEAFEFNNWSARLKIVDSQSGGEIWMRLFDTETLREIKIGSWPSVAERILKDYTTSLTFPNLHTLSLTMHQNVLPLFRLLSQLPSLHRLIVEPIGRSGMTSDQFVAILATIPDTIPDTIVPALQHYQGPYELLHRFQNDSMVSVTIVAFGGIVKLPDPDVLIKGLQSFRQNLRNVEHFDVRVSHLSESFLSDIFLLIPSVKSLHLATSTKNEAFTVSKCFDTLLNMDLPTNIEHLHLWWPPICEIEDAPTRSKAFVIQLLKCQPSLQSVSLAPTYWGLNLEYHARLGQLTGEFHEKIPPSQAQCHDPRVRDSLIHLMFTEKDDNLRLPSEIWAEVFQHISFQHLKLASLACRDFRSIASPELFKEFKVQPYVTAIPSMQHHALSDMEAAKELQKLHFFTSTSIAPFVRKCTVSAQLVGPPRPDNVDYGGLPDKPSIDHVFDATCQHLPRLFNIQKLQFSRISFTPIAISQLSFLPNIPSLIIDTCHMVKIHPPFPVIHTEAFVFGYFWHTELQFFEPQGGAETWIRLFDPETLREIKIGSWPSVAERILRDYVTFPTFPNLHTLSLTMDQNVVLPLFRLLSHLPSLRRLIFKPLSERDRMIADQFVAVVATIPANTIVPALQYYEGPFELLHRFQNDSMVSVTIVGFGRTLKSTDPDVLIEGLKSVKQNLRNVEQFDARVSHLSESFLSDVFSLIPSVKSLHLTAATDNEAFTISVCII
ncbi:hypothetical protein DXG01_007488, partial [Tephrocybe rancida]